MIEIAFVCAGTIAGIITGLIPGIHLNTIAVLVPLFAQKGDFNSILFIVSMSMAHSFSDFIPSTLLGAPSEENYLSVLPAHKMLLRGKGEAAITLALCGALFGTILSVSVSAVYLAFAEQFYLTIRQITPWLLITAIGIGVVCEKSNRKRILAMSLVLVSASLGIVSLKLLAFPDPLFALVSGIFGASMLVKSIGEKAIIPKQSEEKKGPAAGSVFRGTGMGFIAGSIVSMVPSMGSNQSAFMAEKILGGLRQNEYLAMLGSASASGTMLSFLFLASTRMPRTGSAVAVKEIGSIAFDNLHLLAFACLASAGISFLLCKWISGKAVNAMRGMDYSKAGKIVLLLLAGLVLFLCGPIGVAVMAVGCIAGLVPQLCGLKRTHCMAFLAFPTILIYLAI